MPHSPVGGEGDDPPFAHGPINRPVDRFAHLPEPTREWLEQLREGDINDITEAVKFQRSIKTVSRFFRWLIITVVACFVGAAAFGEAIQKLWALIFHGRLQ